MRTKLVAYVAVVTYTLLIVIPLWLAVDRLVWVAGFDVVRRWGRASTWWLHVVVKATWVVPGKDESGLVPTFAIAKRFVDILTQALAESDIAAARIVTVGVAKVT